MTLRWRRISSLEYTAMWQDMYLSVRYEPFGSRPPWQLYVDTTLVTHNGDKRAQWWTHTQAKEAVDAVVNRQLVQLGAKVQARQTAVTV